MNDGEDESLTEEPGASSDAPLRAEDPLRVGDSRLQLALDVAELGTWSWDLTDGTGIIDARGAEIVGLNAGDLDDVFAAQIARIHPDDLEPVQVAAAAGAAAGVPFNLNYRTIHRDGSIHHVASRAGVITDESGRPIRLVGTNRDVTAERESEDALRASEERFRALVAATSDAVYRMSADWSVMRRLEGRNVLADTGEPDSDWVGKYIHPDDQPRVLAAVAGAIRTKSVFQMEHRVIQADDTLGWTFSRAVPILDPSGEIVEWFGAASDVTDRVRAEEALRTARDESDRRRRLYETITGSTPDLIYVFDLNYRFTYANDALLAMWGRSWDDAIGLGLLEIGYEPWHAAMHEREIDQIIATKKSIRGEVSFPHATLGRRIYDYIFAPVLDAEGNVEAVAGTTRDITELRELSRQKDEFIGIVSHELRTPVTSIKAYAQMLHRRFRQEGDTRSAEMVAKMDTQLNRLTDLIDDLLDVTKIEAGQLRFNEAPFDLDPLVAEIIDTLRPTADHHQIVREGRTDARVLGDRERTGQVLTNLLSNAIKYSPRADTVVVRTNADTAHVTIAVQDFGIGIAATDVPHVFDRFYRAGGPTQVTFAGIGLGLYISAEIVRRQGGKIWVESEPGTGSTFSFTVPLHRGESG